MRKCKTEKLLDKNLLTLRISLIFAVRYCSWKRHRAIKLQLCEVKVRRARKDLCNWREITSVFSATLMWVELNVLPRVVCFFRRLNGFSGGAEERMEKVLN